MKGKRVDREVVETIEWGCEYESMRKSVLCRASWQGRK